MASTNNVIERYNGFLKREVFRCKSNFLVGYHHNNHNQWLLLVFSIIKKISVRMVVILYLQGEIKRYNTKLLTLWILLIVKKHHQKKNEVYFRNSEKSRDRTTWIDECAAGLQRTTNRWQALLAWLILKNKKMKTQSTNILTKNTSLINIYEYINI